MNRIKKKKIEILKKKEEDKEGSRSRRESKVKSRPQSKARAAGGTVAYNRHSDSAKKTTNPITLLSPARPSPGDAALVPTTTGEEVGVTEAEEGVVVVFDGIVSE